MLRKIDEGMESRHLDAIMVFGDDTYENPELYYLVRSHLPRGGVYVKKIYEKPTLIVNDVDFYSAKRSRIKDIKTFSRYQYLSIIKEHSEIQALVLLYDRILRDNGIKGRIAVFGKNRSSLIINIVDGLRKLGHRIVGDVPPTLLDELREIKSEDEVFKIKKVGDRTQRVMLKTIEFLANCRRVGKKLYHKGSGLDVGKIKFYIRTWLLEENLQAPYDLIFATGVRSSDPHYSGEDKDLILASNPIVFDLFPKGIEGYWFDLTRTFSIGKPDKKILRMHELVKEAQSLALENLKEGIMAKETMELICEYFEKNGFLTPRTRLVIQRGRGFLHSLGHGIGLTIGEKPFFSLSSNDKLKKGNVFTIEPGLYDPRVGGVRLEDVIVMESRRAKNLT
ncbi:MAG: Xaa-Pro peptidase family protein, partial [Candidatus Bathyarchaeia archaeon]